MIKNLTHKGNQKNPITKERREKRRELTREQELRLENWSHLLTGRLTSYPISPVSTSYQLVPVSAQLTGRQFLT